MRLVVNIAKKHIHQSESLFELISDGNLSLMRAVEKFDFGRGNKFSTYASWAIIKNFARSIPDDRRHRERYVTGHDEMFDAATDKRSNEQEISLEQRQAALEVHELLERLDPREREIIRMRAGLDNYSEGMTLEEIGQQLGITKERVRQLHVRIMKKLEALAGGHKSEQ
jgi:RNA polymerase sigma factor (sigma-70 family)